MESKNGWDIVYEKAIADDGSLFFPEKLSHEFLENAKRTMGSYLFANQYLNEIIPAELQTFKQDWFRYYDQIPTLVNTFIHIDPAISQADGADYTGVVVVDVDVKGDWYVRYAKRHKITPTEIINLVFRLNDEFKPRAIGIEDVAYQKALLYMLSEETKRRGDHLPVTGVRPPTDKNKQMRILGALVPRMEWGRLFLKPGMADLEIELLQFPRGSHDDLIDALASIEYIAMAPQPPKEMPKPKSHNDKNYEDWYRRKIQGGFKDEIRDEWADRLEQG